MQNADYRKSHTTIFDFFRWSTTNARNWRSFARGMLKRESVKSITSFQEPTANIKMFIDSSKPRRRCFVALEFDHRKYVEELVH